jgi:hypothetical protein
MRVGMDWWAYLPIGGLVCAGFVGLTLSERLVGVEVEEAWSLKDRFVLPEALPALYLEEKLAGSWDVLRLNIVCSAG